MGVKNETKQDEYQIIVKTTKRVGILLLEKS